MDNNWKTVNFNILVSKPPKPVLDEDLKALFNYFSTQRACLWDEVGHRDVRPEEFEKLEIYLKAIENINSKLIENENKNL